MTSLGDTLAQANEVGGELADLIVNRRDQWIEANFKILDRGGRLVPFKFNPIQRIYWERRTQRDRILKARRPGISSVVLADILSESMLVPGLECLYMMQKPEEHNLPTHRDRAQLFYDSTDAAWRPELEINNQNRMGFLFPGKRRSTIWFSGSGGQAVGTGKGIHRWVRDELKDWEDAEVSATNRSMLGMALGTRAIDCSSPGPLGGPWHTLWKKATDGADGFSPLLVRWFEVPEFRAEGERILDKSAAEVELQAAHGLDDEQLRWRRLKIKEAGSVEEFWGQYPEDEWNCWATAGSPAMPGEYLRRLLLQAREPTQTAMNGDLRVWLPPSPGESYVIMGDPAEGLATSHLSAAVLRRASDWRHAATLRGHLSPGDFGAALVELGRLYNGALVGWERNNHGWGVYGRVIDHLKYAPVYIYMGVGGEKGDMKVGFPTNQWTKPSLVTLAHDAMSAGMWHSWDAELIGQYLALQDMGGGRYDTSELDMAMADMLCHVARPQAAPSYKVTREANESEYFIPKYLRRTAGARR